MTPRPDRFAAGRTSSGVRRRRLAGAAIVAALGAAAASAAGTPFEPSDYIVRFVQYVRWPSEDEHAPWRVCVTRNVVAAQTDYRGLDARGRPFEVVLVETPDAVAGCHVLDLTGLAPALARPFLDTARPAPVLTIGDGPAFCSAGGIICLQQGSREPSFEINLSAVKRSGLLVNARLMQLGRRRQTPETPP